MNKKEKNFIVNSQEDEDGYNINPDYSFLTENAKNVSQEQSRNNPVNDRVGVFKTNHGSLYGSSRVSEKK